MSPTIIDLSILVIIAGLMVLIIAVLYHLLTEKEDHDGH